MNHLAKDTIPQIEDNLIWVRSVRDSIFSWWFNVTLLVVVLGHLDTFYMQVMELELLLN